MTPLLRTVVFETFEGYTETISVNRLGRWVVYFTPLFLMTYSLERRLIYC